MRPLALVVLALCGCRGSTATPVNDWKEAFRVNAPTAEWGYRHADGYHRMGAAVTLEGDPLARLRTMIGEAREGPFKCLIHIDGRLQAGAVTADVCTGCGILVVDRKEWALRDKEALKDALKSALGERPAEPQDPALEGY